jgi:hypothetical protein
MEDSSAEIGTHTMRITSAAYDPKDPFYISYSPYHVITSGELDAPCPSFPRVFGGVALVPLNRETREHEAAIPVSVSPDGDSVALP